MPTIYQNQNGELVPIATNDDTMSTIPEVEAGTVKVVEYDQPAKVYTTRENNKIIFNYEIPTTNIEIGTVEPIRFDQDPMIETVREGNKSTLNFKLPRSVINIMLSKGMYKANETEMLIGSWDDKPLYRKMVKLENVDKSGNFIIDELPIYDKIIEVKGFVTDYGNQELSLNDQLLFKVSTNNEHQLTLSSPLATVKDLEIVVTFIKVINEEEYVEISDTFKTYPYNYSNVEKVVGTWLDGRPIYERTVYTTNSNVFTDPDIDYVIKSEGTILTSANGSWIPLNVGYATRGTNTTSGEHTFGTQYQLFVVFNDSSGAISISAAGWSYIEAYVTVCYVRKSDIISTTDTGDQNV